MVEGESFISYVKFAFPRFAMCFRCFISYLDKIMAFISIVMYFSVQLDPRRRVQEQVSILVVTFFTSCWLIFAYVERL